MMTAELRDLTATLDGKKILSLVTRDNIADLFNDLRGKAVTVEIKPASRHRSLTANKYAWVLIDGIAERTKMKKTDVYRNAIREIGGVSLETVFPTQECDEWCAAWRAKGLGWMADVLRESTLPGYTAVRLFKGSSSYNTRQMSCLIDSLVQDAQALGMETMPPENVASLLSRWEVKQCQTAS